jgi:hypothetical protein
MRLLAAIDREPFSVLIWGPGKSDEDLYRNLNNAQAHLILATCVNETDGRALLLLVAFP